MDEILKHFQPTTMNNSRAIVRDLLQRFMEKPSFGLAHRLRAIGIGVEWSTPSRDDIQKPEGFYLIDKTPIESISDEELAKIL